MQMVNARNRSIVKANDDVALAHATFSCGTIVFERDDENPAFNREVVVANNATRQRHILSRQTDIAATDFAIANETASDELGGVDRCGKADSLRRQNHRSVHADDLATGVNKWPTGISGIERGISLNHGVHQSAGLRPQRSPKCAYHSGGNGVLKAVRVTDRDDQLPDTNPLRLAKLRRDQIRRIDSDHPEICIWIVAHQIRLVLVTVWQSHFDFLSAMNHMAVRENEAIRREDESRTAAATFLRNS